MSRSEHWAIVLLLAALVALHVALFPFATLVTDSGRDLANAYAVGHGGPYPEYGPGLFGRWKLGPVWFWLLALPLKLGASVTAAALFTGLLAAAKIPLAYGLGLRLLDARLGLLAALLIALPGWSSVGTLVLAHVSVVESALLATAWLALLAWQTRRAGPAVAACLVLALALHAHPTALIAAPAVVLALWRAVLVPRRWGWLAAGAIGFVLPFAPALLAEMRSGWPQAGASLEYLGQMQPGARLARLPALVWALVTGGVWFSARFLLPAPVAVAWSALAVLLLGAALLGGARIGAGRVPALAGAGLARGRLALGAGMALAAVVFIALLRDATPVWMVYCLVPFGVFALALGLHGLLAGWRRAGVAIALLATATLGIDAALLQQRIAQDQAGRILLPGGSVGDITTPRRRPAAYSPWLAVWQFDALAAEACSLPGRLALHGELAMVFDFSQGVAAQLHCDASRLPRLGGRQADRHLAGVPAALARELDFAPEPLQWGHVLRVPRQVLAPERGREAAVDVQYRVDRQGALDAQGDSALSGQVQCQPGEVLVLTNLMPLVNRFALEVHAEGQEASPLARTMAASYYACTGAELAWRIRTPDPASADVVVIARQAR